MLRVKIEFISLNCDPCLSYSVSSVRYRDSLYVKNLEYSFDRDEFSFNYFRTEMHILSNGYYFNVIPKRYVWIITVNCDTVFVTCSLILSHVV